MCFAKENLINVNQLGEQLIQRKQSTKNNIMQLKICY